MTNFTRNSAQPTNLNLLERLSALKNYYLKVPKTFRKSTYWETFCR